MRKDHARFTATACVSLALRLQRKMKMVMLSCLAHPLTKQSTRGDSTHFPCLNVLRSTSTPQLPPPCDTPPHSSPHLEAQVSLPLNECGVQMYT